MLKIFMTIWMGHKTIQTGFIAFLFPIIMICMEKIVRGRRTWCFFRTTVFVIYVIGMLYFTIGNRSSGNRLVRLTPFWTYAFFRERQYRWQIYMNVFLFFPFGFMLGFGVKRGFLESMIIGIMFSASIEVLQYIFCLGLCEIDDVIHNTVGTAVGYGQWRLFLWLENKCLNRMKLAARSICKSLWRQGKRCCARIKTIWRRGLKI